MNSHQFTILSPSLVIDRSWPNRKTNFTLLQVLLQVLRLSASLLASTLHRTSAQKLLRGYHVVLHPVWCFKWSFWWWKRSGISAWSADRNFLRELNDQWYILPCPEVSSHIQAFPVYFKGTQGNPSPSGPPGCRPPRPPGLSRQPMKVRRKLLSKIA